MTNRKIFINLSVNDLQKSIGFFSALGFGFDKQFTDEKAACMVISDEAYVMLLSDPFFRTFTKKQPADTAATNETMLALSCDSKSEVDSLVRKAIDGGGSQAMDTIDQGFMYGRSFYDLDGHHWEVVWMDSSAVQ